MTRPCLKVVDDLGTQMLFICAVECEQQLEKQAKLRSMLQLPPFAPASERVFEDWVDATASQLYQLNVSIAILKGARESDATEAFAARLREIRLPATKDEFVDEVAKHLFDGSQYFWELGA